MIKRFATLPFCVLVLAACSDNITTDTEADEAAIRNLFAKYDETAANGDIDGWFALLTDDVYWGAPKQPALIGQDAVLGRVGPMFSDDFDVTSNTTPNEIRVAEGWGVVSGTYELLLEPNAGGNPHQESGKFIYVVELGTDDQWRIVSAVWNTNHEGAY